jgi:hypothetical protein
VVANHARKNDARRRRLEDGGSHRQAVEAVRDQPAPGAGADGALVVVSPGDRLPDDGFGVPDEVIRRGDVLRVSCPPGVATVAEVWGTDPGDTVVLVWPWTDPETEPGRVAVDIPAPGGPERWPFRITGLTSDVREGDMVAIDIPPSVVHVSYTSGAVVGVFRHGVSETRETMRDGAGHRFLLRPWADAPMTVERLCRPYPMLDGRDRVVDADGVEWEYFEPLDFVTDSNPRLPRVVGPRWPLTLVGGLMAGREPDPARVRTVAQATASGTHEEELVRWRAASGADVVEYETEDVADVLSPQEKAALATRTRRQVAGMTLPEVEEEREHARMWWRLASKSVHDEDDQARMEAASVCLDTLDAVLAEMRAAGAPTSG